MRTRWPIIDILCSDGWRLNSTRSPLMRWRSTLSPSSSRRSLAARMYARLMRRPSSRMMNLAPVSPGGGCGPLSTRPCSFSMLNGVTVSGNVKFSAMDHGTPSSSMPMLGSPVMTVRAEKSTRLPMRLPRMRPSLDLSRWLIDLIGRPDFCMLGGWPGSVLSKYVVMWYCTSWLNSLMMCCGAPDWSWRRSWLLARVISASLCVRSSSHRALESIITAGRTGGGGTGSTVRIIHEGRVNSVLKPSTRASSSEMRRRMSKHRSADSSWRRSPVSGPSSSFLGLGNSHMIFMPSRRYCGCGAPVASSMRLLAHMPT
mmetsp:Transcript_45128/g.134766  ORF Transcript_45128/g.134766 Transcript_45128/m.134766 type:complete len:314 (+) Transcript_45128:3340-4281(+)